MDVRHVLKTAFWPFDQIGLKEVADLPEHEKAAIRLRNRWRLDALMPFIQRWFVLVGMLGLSLNVIDHMPETVSKLVLMLLLGAAWWGALCFTGLLVWLWSMRPR